MTKITIQLSRNLGFYYSMPVYLSVYKRVDTYDLDTLSDNVVNKLAVGERTKVISFVEGKEAFDKRLASMRQAVIDELTEKHTSGNAVPTIAKVEDVPVEEPTVVETKTEEVKEETPVVAQEETEVKATTVKRTRTTTKKVAE